MLQYLTQTLHYPPALIAVEKEILLNDVKKRFDILVYHESAPWMIIECKEMNVPLSEHVLTQVLQYNISVQAAFIILTNGKQTAGFELAAGTATLIDQLPAYPSAIS